MEQIKAPIFFRDSFSNQDNVQALIQLRKERQSHYLKVWFFTKDRGPSIFKTMVAELFKWSNETSWFFPALKSTSYFLQGLIQENKAASDIGQKSAQKTSVCWMHKSSRLGPVLPHSTVSHRPGSSSNVRLSRAYFWHLLPFLIFLWHFHAP